MSKTCIPDLSVTHWFRLHRNTLLDGSQVFPFLLSLSRLHSFFLPLYANVSHMETAPSPCLPPSLLSPPGMYFILAQHSAITPSLHTKIDCTNFRKSDTPTVHTSSSQLPRFLSPQVRTNLQTRDQRLKRLYTTSYS